MAKKKAERKVMVRTGKHAGAVGRRYMNIFYGDIRKRIQNKIHTKVHSDPIAAAEHIKKIKKRGGHVTKHYTAHSSKFKITYYFD